MKPFLLLATRAEDVAADDEYEAFLDSGGLREAELVRRRLEQGPLGEVDLAAFSGVLLGGSSYTVSDPREAKSGTQRRVETELRALLADVVARDAPFLGACYGIGTAAAAASSTGATASRSVPSP